VEDTHIAVLARKSCGVLPLARIAPCLQQLRTHEFSLISLFAHSCFARVNIIN
jgi:hypothetical protein